jgi:hypothetical protein
VHNFSLHEKSNYLSLRSKRDTLANIKHKLSIIVSFIGYNPLKKSLLCKCTVEIGKPYLSRVFQNIQSLIINYGNALI